MKGMFCVCGPARERVEWFKRDATPSPSPSIDNKQKLPSFSKEDQDACFNDAEKGLMPMATFVSEGFV